MSAADLVLFNWNRNRYQLRTSRHKIRSDWRRSVEHVKVSCAGTTGALSDFLKRPDLNERWRFVFHLYVHFSPLFRCRVAHKKRVSSNVLRTRVVTNTRINLEIKRQWRSTAVFPRFSTVWGICATVRRKMRQN